MTPAPLIPGGDDDLPLVKILPGGEDDLAKLTHDDLDTLSQWVQNELARRVIG